jgi:hypothetical protein
MLTPSPLCQVQTNLSPLTLCRRMRVEWVAALFFELWPYCAFSSIKTNLPPVVLPFPTHAFSCRLSSTVNATSHLVFASKLMPVGVMRPDTGCERMTQLRSGVHQVSFAANVESVPAAISAREKMSLKFVSGTDQRPESSLGKGGSWAYAQVAAVLTMSARRVRQM